MRIFSGTKAGVHRGAAASSSSWPRLLDSPLDEGELRPAHRGPSVLSLYPRRVAGAVQKVTVISERTHFGPQTTVRSPLPGVLCQKVRFVSPEEMSFEVFVREGKGLGEGTAVPIAIRSPKGEGRLEELGVEVRLTEKVELLELDLASFQGEDVVTTEYDFVVFGYRPRGYAPFHFKAVNLATAKVLRQETREEIEHLGALLAAEDNPFELTLSDSLGREVKKTVLVRPSSPRPPRPPGPLRGLLRLHQLHREARPVEREPHRPGGGERLRPGERPPRLLGRLREEGLRAPAERLRGHPGPGGSGG
jgi:hypothetical protein